MTDPAAAARLTLAVGDRVVYPNQGVCRVTAVESKDIAGQRLMFVTLKREEDNAVVMVPEAKVVSIGLRKVGDSTQVDGIFEFLRSDSDKANLDWKQRARANVERMSQGGLMGLAEVVKGLQVLSELRPLPAKERELYDNARHLLVEEIAASLKIDPADAEDTVDVILFPPGKERPKRTAEEFRLPSLDDDAEMDLDDPLLAVVDDLELPPGDEPHGEDDTEVEGRAVESEDTPTKLAKPAATRGRPRKKPLETPASNSDDEVTEPEAQAAPPAPQAPSTPQAPRKRGRPPKPKPPGAELPKVPKKRGRPPKVRPPEPVEAAPKKPKAPAAAASAPAKWAKAAAKVPNTGKKR